jgi:pyrophosphatase PpaX
MGPDPGLRESPGTGIVMGKPVLQGVFFDLDGTLINSAPMIIKAIQEIFTKYHLGPISPETIKSYAGMPPESIFQALAPERKDLLLQETILLERKYRYLAPAYPGVAELIGGLASLAIRLAAITSQARQEMQQVRESYPFTQQIELWISCEDIGHPKPHPESILTAIDHFQLRPGEVLFVGDTEYDIQAGKNAGVKTGAALWGGHNHQAMAQLDPDYSFHQPGEILSAFFR